MNRQPKQRPKLQPPPFIPGPEYKIDLSKYKGQKNQYGEDIYESILYPKGKPSLKERLKEYFESIKDKLTS